MRSQTNSRLELFPNCCTLVYRAIALLFFAQLARDVTAVRESPAVAHIRGSSSLGVFIHSFGPKPLEEKPLYNTIECLLRSQRAKNAEIGKFKSCAPNLY